MKKINVEYFQKWLLSSLSVKSTRHLFFDFNDRLINHLLDSYSKNGSISFLPANFNFWVFSPTKSDLNYTEKDKLSRINDSDLIEIRNKSEDNAFIVFVSDITPVIIPSDNITSVSEKYYNSQLNYIDFVCNNVFINQFNYDAKILDTLKNYISNECSDNLDFCFYKNIDNSVVLDFFGVIGNERHLNGRIYTLSTYYTDFISRLNDILNKDGFIGLEDLLANYSVKNYSQVIDAFKREGYNSAKEFSLNINNVFLKNTTFYRSLIDVDEWILALKDENNDYSIEYKNKTNEDAFSIVRINNNINSQGLKFILKREAFNTYLSSKNQANWNINSESYGFSSELNVSKKNEIIDIKAILGSETKALKLINYDKQINRLNSSDFGLSIKEKYKDDFLLIKVKQDEKFINETNISLNNIFNELLTKNTDNLLLNKQKNYNIYFKTDLINITNQNSKLFEVKDKILFENSDLDLTIRFVNKDSDIDLIILEDENGEPKINYDNRVEIETKTIITENEFKDIKIFLQNISSDKLYLKIITNGFAEWLIFSFVPVGIKEPLVVKNYFQKYQVLNDSSFSKSVIRVESKLRNDIHFYYFEDKYGFDHTYLPTIFNFEGNYVFVNDNLKNPYFLDTANYNLYLDFRPDRSIFDKLVSSIEFKKYDNIRHQIFDWYRNKFISFDIKTIDDIDFSTDDILKLSTDYLSSYNNLLLLDENAKWLDTFYFCEIKTGFKRLENIPLAVFFSPFNPILIYQLVSKMRLMRAALDNIRKPNSISSLFRINVLDCWVLDINASPFCYFSIETDSVLFTGFVFEQKLYNNILEHSLKRFGVSYSQGVGHLSYSQIQSALNKSYSYLSNKSNFNIKLEGKLVDESTNEAILNWIENKSAELSNLYSNFKLNVNVYDDREFICYPKENLLAFYKEEKGLNFNWYKGVSSIKSFDITLITSLIPDVSIINQSSPQYLSHSFTYKNLINLSLSHFSDFALHRDIFFKNQNQINVFDDFISIINAQFKSKLNFNQTKTLIISSSFADSEVVAMSSDISNTSILETVAGKSLWEFSISDYSYKDKGKGDYLLIANEQEVYTSNFKKFLNEIDPNSSFIFDQILKYSKQTGLFQLKDLLSNQNYIKGFIASVAARKIFDFIIQGSSDTFIIPYDVFKSRLHKIKIEIDPNYTENGTQFPDFILIQISFLENRWVIDLRLVEIKYRDKIITDVEISKILNDQTNKIKYLFCKLNTWRTNDVNKYGIWTHTLSMILSEMSQFYFNNSLNINTELKKNFANAINEDYLFRINDSLLISLDNSTVFLTGKVNSGVFMKIPKSKINHIFSNSDQLGYVKDFLATMIRNDTCSDLNSLNVDFTLPESYIEDVHVEPIFSVVSANVSSSIAFDNLESSNNNDIQNINTFESNKSQEVNNFNVIFGKDLSNREVIYYPKGKGASPLPNYNIMVTGSSGKGKTQFIKSFIFQQGRKETSFTVIDFKNDYSDNEFCKFSNLKKVAVKLNGIPYNPLIPRVVKDEDSGDKFYDVSEHINGICSVLGSTFGLGDQQEAQLKRAIREVFKLSGIESKGSLKYSDDIIFPTFNEVGEYLENGDKELEKLYNRLDPLFDLNLFPDIFKNVGFENVIKESFVIKVSDIQNDKIKNAIAKLIVVSAHGYYLASTHRSNVYKYFVFDEAHRVLDSPFVEKFIRECRAFGVGVLLSSQQPDDFPSEVLGQLATKIIHGNEGSSKLTKKIKDLISFTQDDRYISNLQTFEAIVNNQDYDNLIIKTLSWPHLMILESIKDFPLGINLNDLKINLLNRDVKDSDLTNILKNLIDKKYIKVDNDLYKIDIY